MGRGLDLIRMRSLELTENTVKAGVVATSWPSASSAMINNYVNSEHYNRDVQVHNHKN